LSTSSKNSPSVFLFGPTGVGKTRFLTEDLPPGFEVVAADSIQVYRGLDIGSAKPTADERARVPHHLIDIRDPQERFDVGDFVQEASAASRDITSRGQVPVLSGGTAFYFHNYLLGMPETPVADLEVRAEVQRKWDGEGEESFRRALAEVDPVSEARIKPHDAYRLQRAWEVWVCSGRPLSSFGRTGPAVPGPVFVAGLDRPRADLYARIEVRVDAMLQAGLEDEVRSLVAAGCGPGTPAMKGIGYAEWFPWVVTGEGSQQEVRDRIVLNSRHYAKRQLTFFRSLPGVRWYDPDRPEVLLSDLRDWSLTNAPGWW
jgi:tRNA dimethylallyltransferase